MQCKDIQIQIGSGETLTKAEAEHVSGCADCAQFQKMASLITEAAPEWNDEEPESALERRIRLAVAAGVPPKRSIKIRYLAIAGLAGVVLFAAPLLRTKKSSFNALADYKRMMQKIADATSAHSTIWLRPGEFGPMRKFEDDWYKPGAWRKTALPGLGGDRLILKEASGLKYYKFDPETSKVVKMIEGAKQPDAFSIENLIKSYESRREGLIVDEGRYGPEGMTITAHSSDNYHRYVFLVDPKTHLPLQAEFQHPQSGSWDTYLRLDFEFQGPYANKFDPADLVPKP